MKVLGYSFVGVRAEGFDSSAEFFEKVVQLERVPSRTADHAVFRMPSGELFELFGPKNEYDWTFECPVVGFEVDDLQAARTELLQLGVEGVSDLFEAPGGSAWCHFRGPDGQIYEIANHPRSSP